MLQGNWKEWVCCSSRKIDTISIPSGANLNDYREKGFYVSHKSGNSITNLPSDYDGNGAFELTVTGIGADGYYCSQWLKSYVSNDIWVRTQYSSKAPWAWRAWEKIILPSTPVLTPNGIELGQSLPSTAAHGGYIDFHFNGNTNDYTTRLIESAKGTLSDSGNMDVAGWLQCSNGFWMAGGGLYANSNTNIYGTNFPSGHTKGRIFFKKT